MQITKNENLIIKGIGGFYYIKTEDTIVEARAKGVFRKRGISPLPGDFVKLEKEAGTYVISEICARKNVFVRPPVANIDIFFIVISTTQPVPNLLVIDKLAAIACAKEAQPVLIITKQDLLSPQSLIDAYKTSNINTIVVDINKGDGLDEIKELIKDKCCIFSGNSGVGKSTLLAALLPDIEFETGEISHKLKRGRHTTRQVTLYEAFGGFVADTPGFASLEMGKACHIPKEELQFAFSDIKPYFGKCKFTGCSHTGEIGCAVKQAFNEGIIAENRYNNYITMYNEAKGVSEWQRQE